MTTEERRKHVLEKLNSAVNPISASSLASVFNVSRQIIVGDIALLRAQGYDINSTPRGYLIEKNTGDGLIKTIICKHDLSLTEKELNACVDFGCKVINVIIEHPIYGQLTGELMISSRYDVKQFIDKVNTDKVHSLSELTNDFHIHTLKCPNEEAFNKLCNELDSLGILVNE